MSPEVTPAERWATFLEFPEPHKITGNLTDSLNELLGYENTLQYISKKDNISSYHIGGINQHALKKYLLSQKVFTRASTVKLIHGWIPTYVSLCRQGRMHSLICLQCKEHIESSDHIRVCDHPSEKVTLLDNMLHKLEK